MDFEHAAQRLEKDQQKLRGRKPVAVSAKAKREADYRKKQQERVREQRQREQQQKDFMDKYYKSCDRALGVKPLGSNGSPLLLTPTSIWGEGDKIALPPSVLEHLTQSQEDGGAMMSSPWMFRIGILKDNYKYPASPLLQTMKPTEGEEEDSDEEHDNATVGATKEAYLDELKHKYISYTHGTVVEFTQDEGHVGLPSLIAKALLDNHQNEIPTRRTQDPSKTASEDDNAMQTDEVEERTPGHIAYGAFEVPDTPVEITMVKLPKGKACTLTPTPEAVRNGFYNLQNIKLVLEQSLIRTRATLSLGDCVQSWHRGVQYDLVVSKLVPSTFQAVTCINTDIEVDFGKVEGLEEANDTTSSVAGQTLSSSAPAIPLSGGRTLASSSAPAPVVEPTQTTNTKKSTSELLPEPPSEQKENVCTVQIRAEQSGRRRFDVTSATVNDLFEFASTLTNIDASQFRLVTRFPRRVFENTNGGSTLKQAGLEPGQELFLIEKL